jgi:hypothetical protein
MYLSRPGIITAISAGSGRAAVPNGTPSVSEGQTAALSAVDPAELRLAV